MLYVIPAPRFQSKTFSNLSKFFPIPPGDFRENELIVSLKFSQPILVQCQFLYHLKTSENLW